MFKALVIDSGGGSVMAQVRELDPGVLPAGTVTVAVE